MQVRWLPRALRNLEQIADYIGADNPGAAARLEQRLLKSVTNLSAHPQLGRSGRVTGTRELVIPGTPYIVAYRVREHSIEVLRVIHSARKWPVSF